MSFGGVLGGLFNALLAPLLFTSVIEYPLVLVLACLLLETDDGRRTTNDERLHQPSLVIRRLAARSRPACCGRRAGGRHDPGGAALGR